MAEFVRLHNRADGLDCAVGDVEAEDVDQAAGRIETPSTRLAVDLRGPQLHTEPVSEAK